MKDHLWFKSYPKGVPHEIDPGFTRSLVTLLDESFKTYPDLPAYHHMGVEFSYQKMDEYSKMFAAYLQNHTDLKPGDRIAFQMPNVMQYPIAMFGAIRAGFVVVNTNPLYTPREMEHQFKDSGAKAIVILENFADKLQKVISKTDIKHVIIARIPDMMSFPKSLVVGLAVKYVKKMIPSYSLPGAVMFKDALAKGKASAFKAAAPNPEDIAFIQYTGGTTGVSKGGVLTHRNVLANLAQMKAWMGTKLVTHKEVIITALPLYHIFSLTVNCFLFAHLGGMNVLITNPRDFKGFIADLKKFNFTAFTGVNTLFNALTNFPEFKEVNFSHLKLTVAGAMALQSSVAEKWKEVTGSTISEGYGLTECSPVVSCNPIEDGDEIVGTIGMPMPSTDVKIVDENGNEVPQGEAGEMWVQGPQRMQGYWQRPDETANTITEDGWLKTGDMAMVMDNGFLKIVDRKKDMILVSGFNVYPNEVEEVVAMNEKVLEVAAVGVPDEKSTEAVKVFVVKKDNSLTAEELKAHCKENLTGYKVPKHYEFRDELPKSNVGKILRRMLREEDSK